MRLVPCLFLLGSASGLRIPLAARRVVAPVLCAGDLSWQEELKTVLSPDTPQSDREVLLKDLLARGPEIAKEVTDAISAGPAGLQTLMPPSSTADQQLLDDLAAVQQQVMEDILPQVGDVGKLQEAMQRAAAEAPTLAQDATRRGPVAVASLLQDPARALALVQGEARNVFSRTPEGLETPSYRVLSSGEGFEVRSYPSYGVAVASMGAAAAADDLFAAGRAFNSLAAFFFGANARAESLDMTTPLRVDVEAAGAQMAFPLPSKYSASTAPAPSEDAISLRQTPAQSFAVAPFAGFATEGEVRRQRAALTEKLQRCAMGLADADAYSVFQYNPPYTLPWLRRNEIAIPIVVADDTPQADAPPTAPPNTEVRAC